MEMCTVAFLFGDDEDSKDRVRLNDRPDTAPRGHASITIALALATATDP